jgi:8-oxo-dGTP diphosphatase
VTRAGEDDSPGGEEVTVRAAGAVPWRRRNAQLEVALVHRPRYDDWSWPKGKLDPGEEPPVAAVREVWEETGLRVRLGLPLPLAEYASVDPSDQPATKRVHYWAGEVVGGDGALVNEIDEVVWLDVDSAAATLTYPRDNEQLSALVQEDHACALSTWPLVLVRHAHAEARSTWSSADHLRPLEARGSERAKALVPFLSAFGVTRVVTSPSIRCLDTVLPYGAASGYGTRLKSGLSEEAFAKHPERAIHHLARLLDRGEPAVLCTHGLILPGLFEVLAAVAEPNGPLESSATAILSHAAAHDIGKGEALVAHVVGKGAQARVVGAERHPAR